MSISGGKGSTQCFLNNFCMVDLVMVFGWNSNLKNMLSCRSRVDVSGWFRDELLSCFKASLKMGRISEDLWPRAMSL